MAVVTRILALHGPQGSGKSIIANSVVVAMSDKGAKARRMSFAEPMRWMLETFLSYQGAGKGADLSHFTTGGGKERPTHYLGGRSPRHALRTLGTEWGREMLDTDLWVNATMRRIDHLQLDVAVIDDLRFPNEWEAVDLRNGTIARICRDGTSFSGEHPSDCELNLPMGRVENDAAPPLVAQRLLATLGW